MTHAGPQTFQVNTRRGWLLFVIGTVVACPLTLVVPYGAEATEYLLFSTKYWLYDRFPNPISVWRTLFDEVLTFGLTALYFGAVVALVGSGNKRQTLLGAGWVIIYFIGTCYVLYRRMFVS
jgi:ABC-type transport system involved in multi-copper enzyme maturation permease subunit